MEILLQYFTFFLGVSSLLFVTESLRAEGEWENKVHDDVIAAYDSQTHVRILVWASPQVTGLQFASLASSILPESETTPRTFSDDKMFAVELDESEMVALAAEKQV